MKHHPAAELFPMLNESELAALSEDIKANGLNQPIVTFAGAILDGRNRFQACELAGVKPKFQEWQDTGDPTAWVISQNLHRRHLNTSQRAMVAARLANKTEGRPKKNVANLPSIEEAADLLNVSPREVVDAKAILKESAPEVVAAIDSGKSTIHKEKRRAKRKRVISKLKKIETKKSAANKGVYDVLIVDPPWPMEKIERDCRDNQVKELDYPLMTLAEISAMTQPAAKNCHLWLWTTHRFLPAAFGVLAEWGFKYVCTFVWHKSGGFQPYDLPQYNCEFAIYARKGSPVFVETKALPVCFEGKRGKHSEKPIEFYDMVRRVTSGRRLDRFSRRKLEGFDGDGQEAS